MSERIIEVQTEKYHFKGTTRHIRQRIGMVDLLDRADRYGPLVGIPVTLGLFFVLGIVQAQEKFFTRKKNDVPVRKTTFPSLRARQRHSEEQQPF